MALILTKHQFKVVLAVIRKTYGFNQTHDRITNGQIAEMTGFAGDPSLHRQNQLLEMGILVNKGRKIGQQNYFLGTLTLSETGKAT